MIKNFLSLLISKKVKALICVSIFCIFLVLSCAAVFKGTSDNVDFSSKPDGAKVYVNGVLRGTTPLELKLESKRTYNIEFKKEGYETRNFTLTNHVGVGWIILDVIFGIVPVVVDAATGSWYVLDQDYVKVEMEKE